MHVESQVLNLLAVLGAGTWAALTAPWGFDGNLRPNRHAIGQVHWELGSYLSVQPLFKSLFDGLGISLIPLCFRSPVAWAMGGTALVFTRSLSLSLSFSLSLSLSLPLLSPSSA